MHAVGLRTVASVGAFAFAVAVAQAMELLLTGRTFDGTYAEKVTCNLTNLIVAKQQQCDTLRAEASGRRLKPIDL
jgi:hypothetical protein